MTKLLYHTDQSGTRFSARVVSASKTSLVLDQTMFYPQGGGQPWDTGIITDAFGHEFHVHEVRKIDGIVHHIGTTNHEFHEEDEIEGHIHEERRLLHSRLHSAAHLIDLAMDRIGCTLPPTKGYSYPEGAYVEYAWSENYTQDLTSLIEPLTSILEQLVHQNLPIEISMVPETEIAGHVVYPPTISFGENVRVVTIDGYGIACGGTHVPTTGAIGPITIRKIKRSGDSVRVAYALA